MTQEAIEQTEQGMSLSNSFNHYNKPQNHSSHLVLKAKRDGVKMTSECQRGQLRNLLFRKRRSEKALVKLKSAALR